VAGASQLDVNQSITTHDLIAQGTNQRSAGRIAALIAVNLQSIIKVHDRIARRACRVKSTRRQAEAAEARCRRWLHNSGDANIIDPSGRAATNHCAEAQNVARPTGDATRRAGPQKSHDYVKHLEQNHRANSRTCTINPIKFTVQVQEI
jgi:hypothetical protein